MGLFQPRKVNMQKIKEKKFSRSQENEVSRVIFCKNASFYSMNSNPAENQSLKKSHTIKNKNRKSALKFFFKLQILLPFFH